MSQALDSNLTPACDPRNQSPDLGLWTLDKQPPDPRPGACPGPRAPLISGHQTQSSETWEPLTQRTSRSQGLASMGPQIWGPLNLRPREPPEVRTPRPRTSGSEPQNPQISMQVPQNQDPRPGTPDLEILRQLPRRAPGIPVISEVPGRVPLIPQLLVSLEPFLACSLNISHFFKP